MKSKYILIIYQNNENEVQISKILFKTFKHFCVKFWILILNSMGLVWLLPSAYP